MTDRPIPLFDVDAQYERLRPQIDARVQAVLEHGKYILGPEVEDFERRLTELAGGTHAISVGNGTDALVIALIAEGIGHGDAVFVPSFTYIATAGAVIAAGAVPVFCDVDPATLALDPEDLARKAATLPEGLRARAVIPVDLFGLPADYSAIADIAAEHDLLVVADAAQSLGGARDGVPVGGLAPVTATSFYPTKPLGTFGDGGALFTADAERAARIRSIRTHGGGQIDGVNSRLDTLQAAILMAKLEVFEADRRRRSEVAALYDAALAGHVGLQASPPGYTSAHAVYAIFSDQRDRIEAAFAERGIGSRAYYATPLHLTPVMRRYGSGEGSLPVTEELSRRILAIPIHASLEDGDVARVAETVIEAVGQPAAKRGASPA